MTLAESQRGTPSAERWRGWQGLGEGLYYCCSDAQLCPTPLCPHGLQHARLPHSSPFPGVCSNSCPLSRWCYLTISSSATPFSFCIQSFPSLESFPISWLFTSSSQSIGASASASVLPKNIQSWFPLGLTGLISLQSKSFSWVFSSTTIRKSYFFGAQLFLWSIQLLH